MNVNSEDTERNHIAEYVRCERHGLDVPKVTKDEAERLGLPFGCPAHLAEMEQAPDPVVMTGDERAEEVTKHLCSPMFVPMDLIHQRIEALVGRPVWTHEMARAEHLAEEARTWQHPVDLEAHVIGSLDQMAGNRPVIIARVGEQSDGTEGPK